MLDISAYSPSRIIAKPSTPPAPTGKGRSTGLGFKETTMGMASPSPLGSIHYCGNIRFGGVVHQGNNVELRRRVPILPTTVSDIQRKLLIHNMDMAENQRAIQFFLNGVYSFGFPLEDQSALSDTMRLVGRPVDTIISDTAGPDSLKALLSTSGKRYMMSEAGLDMGPIYARAPYGKVKNHSVREKLMASHFRDLETLILQRCGMDETQRAKVFKDLTKPTELNGLQALAYGTTGLVDGILVGEDRVITREDLNNHYRKNGWMDADNQITQPDAIERFNQKRSNIEKMVPKFSRPLKAYNPASHPAINSDPTNHQSLKEKFIQDHQERNPDDDEKKSTNPPVRARLHTPLPPACEGLIQDPTNITNAEWYKVIERLKQIGGEQLLNQHVEIENHPDGQMMARWRQEGSKNIPLLRKLVADPDNMTGQEWGAVIGALKDFGGKIFVKKFITFEPALEIYNQSVFGFTKRQLNISQQQKIYAFDHLNRVEIRNIPEHANGILDDDTIYFSDGFGDGSAEQIKDALLKLHEKKQATVAEVAESRADQPPFKPSHIKILQNSPGGYIASLSELRSTLNSMKNTTPVDVIVQGMAASCGALLLSSATGNRFATPSARIMIHEPAFCHPHGPGDHYFQRVTNSKKTRAEVAQIIADATGRPVDAVQQDCETDIWLNPIESMFYGSKGLVDAVLLDHETVLTREDVKQYLTETVFEGNSSKFNQYWKTWINRLRDPNAETDPAKYDAKDPFNNPLQVIQAAGQRYGKKMRETDRYRPSMPPQLPSGMNRVVDYYIPNPILEYLTGIPDASAPLDYEFNVPGLPPQPRQMTLSEAVTRLLPTGASPELLSDLKKGGYT